MSHIVRAWEVAFFPAFAQMHSVRNFTLVFFTAMLAFSAVGQRSFERVQEKTMAEGMALYELEQAAWLASDVLKNSYPALLDSVKGYVSYHREYEIVCIFYSNADSILAEFGFDPFLNPETAVVTTARRMPTDHESQLIALREAAVKVLSNDTGITWVPGTSLNPVPLVRGRKRQVYVLNSSLENDLVLGNDYLLVFSTKGKLRRLERLHNNPIRIPMDAGEQDSMQVRAMRGKPPNSSLQQIFAPCCCTAISLIGASISWLPGKSSPCSTSTKAPY